MFFIGRPLTLLAIAVCTYITITWRFRSQDYPPSALGNDDENGFRKYEAGNPHSMQTASAVTGQVDSLQQQHLAIHSTTSLDVPPKSYGPERPSATSLPASAPTELSVQRDEYLKDMLDWSRPEHRNGHWPPYEDYVDKDYDPNRWEGFKLYDTVLFFP
jgi:hypothetical protein